MTNPTTTTDPTALTAPSHPLGLTTAHIHPSPTHFRLLHLGGFWYKGDYIATTSSGTRYLKATHKTWSSVRSITDAAGETIYKMRMDNLHPKGVFYLEHPDGTRAATVKGRLHWKYFNADLSFTGVDGEEVTMGLRAQGMANERFEVTWGESVVGRVVRHDYNGRVRKEEGASQTYDLSVAGGVDAALMIFLVMALEDNLTLFRISSLTSPLGAVVGVTAAVRGARDKDAGPAAAATQKEA